MSEGMILLLVKGIWETLVMTSASGFLGFLIGLPVGVLLYITRTGRHCAADCRRCTVYCPYGGKRPAGDPVRTD